MRRHWLTYMGCCCVLLRSHPHLAPTLLCSPQADDGWKTVHYRGQPLADFRAAFERQVPRPAGGGGGAAAAKETPQPTRQSGRQRKKKRFDSDSEGEPYIGGDALTDEAYAMFLSAAEQQAQQAQRAQQAAAQQAQQEMVVELPPGAEVRPAVAARSCLGLLLDTLC